VLVVFSRKPPLNVVSGVGLGAGLGVTATGVGVGAGAGVGVVAMTWVVSVGGCVGDGATPASAGDTACGVGCGLEGAGAGDGAGAGADVPVFWYQRNSQRELALLSVVAELNVE
jgi:hypothetical protein